MNPKFSTIFSNTSAQLVAKFFGAGLTLITTYYTIRLAGLELYGDLTKILVLVAVGFTAIDFGLNAEAIRSASSDSQIKQILTHTIWARLTLSLLAIIGLNLLVFFLPGGYSVTVKSIFWLGSLAIMFQGIYTSCNAYFQYHLSYWRSTLSVVVGSLLGTVLTLYYLKFSPSIFHLVLANTLGYLTMAIASLFLLPHPQFAYLKIADLKFLLPLLRRSLTLGLILIASVFASKVDTVILGIFRSSSEVGEYGFAYRIFDVILVLPVFVMNAVYPLLVRLNSRDKAARLIKRTMLTMLTLGLVIAISLWLVAPLVNLVKPGLAITISSLRLLAFSLPFFYVTAPQMWSLISKNRDHQVLGVYFAAALLNTSLNLWLIPSLGTTAAAINTGITELFIFLALVYCSRKL